MVFIPLLFFPLYVSLNSLPGLSLSEEGLYRDKEPWCSRGGFGDARLSVISGLTHMPLRSIIVPLTHLSNIEQGESKRARIRKGVCVWEGEWAPALIDRTISVFLSFFDSLDRKLYKKRSFLDISVAYHLHVKHHPIQMMRKGTECGILC